jgi:hypothetical protein
MQENNIKPEAITKPIQLLAVWLLGLVILVSGLLTAAKVLEHPSWLPVFLSISAVAIIPLFLFLIFLLQTKYRPEMQEDIYYAKYLNEDTNRFERLKKHKEKNVAMDEIIEISNKTKDQLEKMSDMLAMLANHNNHNKLKPLIIDSEEQLNNLQKKLRLNNIELSINKKIPIYNDIVEIIKNVGFTKFDEFGANYIPNDFVISFGKSIPANIIREIVTPLSKITDGYVKISTTSENAIVIGSYRYSDKKSKIDNEFIQKLANASDSQNVLDLI